MPSQIVFAERAPIGRSRGERVDVGRARLRLHADHAHAVERRRASARPMPLASPPPPSGTTTSFSVGCLAGELEPDRPLARHHLRLVEGVHRREALGLGQALRLGARLVVARRPRSAPRRRTGAPPPPWPAAPAPASRAPHAPRPRAPRTPPPARGCPRWPPRRPRRSASRGSPRIMCVAPRALNEPVSWRFSAFSSTRAPTRRDSSPDESSGVSRTRPARARAASSTSA